MSLTLDSSESRLSIISSGLASIRIKVSGFNSLRTHSGSPGRKPEGVFIVQ